MPTGQPGFDPLPAALAAEEPKGRGWLDPVGNLFDFVKWRTSMAGLQVWQHLSCVSLQTRSRRSSAARLGEDMPVYHTPFYLHAKQGCLPLLQHERQEIQPPGSSPCKEICSLVNRAPLYNLCVPGLARRSNWT